MKNTAKAKDRETELIRAAADGRTEIVQALLEAGADQDAKDTEDDTALIHAADNCHFEIVQALLDPPAHVDVQDDAEVLRL
jgi:uncharacterized protein